MININSCDFYDKNRIPKNGDAYITSKLYKFKSIPKKKEINNKIIPYITSNL